MLSRTGLPNEGSDQPRHYNDGCCNADYEDNPTTGTMWLRSERPPRYCCDQSEGGSTERSVSPFHWRHFYPRPSGSWSWNWLSGVFSLLATFSCRVTTFLARRGIRAED